MKVFRKITVAFVMIILFIANAKNASAAEPSFIAAYDMEQGGSQNFMFCDKNGTTIEVIIEEIYSDSRIADGAYKISYKNTGAWEAGFYLKISDNQITDAYSPFYSVATGNILAPNLARTGTKEAVLSFIYKQAAISYSTGVVAKISGTELIVGQKI